MKLPVFITAAITVLTHASPALSADSPWQIFVGPQQALTANAASRLTTDYYRVQQWGLLSTTTTEWHEEWFYPTAADRREAGVYNIDAHKIGRGDFDGDGRQDLVVSWAIFPHTLEHPTIAPTLLLNKGDALILDQSVWSGAPPERVFAYHVGVNDYNLDGVDDAAFASMGTIRRLADGGFQNRWERIPLMMSQGNKQADFSARIAGQESGVLPSFTFGHDIATGDINGDGLPDFYQGRHLFIGDGSGGFTLRQDLLPQEAGPGFHYVMSSAIGDLDNDGSDDLVIGIADGQAGPEVVSGWIFLSNGSGGLVNARKVALPVGRYGLSNTKHNSMALADINDDGRLDILIGQTQANPYYEGRQLQLLINQGGGQFVDESATRVAAGARPDASGEGLVQVLDLNGDGYLDIVDSAGAKPDDTAILVNDGHGVFSRLPTAQLPIVQNYHLAGNESWEGESYGIARTGYIYPVDVDGNGIASFLVQMMFPAERWPQFEGDRNRSTFYLISPLQAYQPVSGPKNLSDTECLLNWAETMVPSMLPDSGASTQRLDAFQYRHYPSTNTYLAIRSKRVLVYQPSVSGEVADYGGVGQYLPAARAMACGG